MSGTLFGLGMTLTLGGCFVGFLMYDRLKPFRAGDPAVLLLAAGLVLLALAVTSEALA